MIASGSTYFIVACIVVGAMALIGMGLLFVRASNIERPNFVATVTLVTATVAATLLWQASQSERSQADALAWSAMTLSIVGFAAGRIMDAVLGARRRVRHDPATLDADLAD